MNDKHNYNDTTQADVDNQQHQQQAPSPPLRVEFGSRPGSSRMYDSTFMQGPPRSIARSQGAGAGLSLRARRLLGQAAEKEDALAAVQLWLLMHRTDAKTNPTTPNIEPAEMDMLRTSIRVRVYPFVQANSGELFHGCVWRSQDNTPILRIQL